MIHLQGRKSFDLKIRFKSVLVVEKGGAALEVDHLEIVLDPIIADALDGLWQCNVQAPATCCSMAPKGPRLGPSFQPRILHHVCSELHCGFPGRTWL